MFKVGDKVRIREDSIYYRLSSRSNPRHKEGIITQTGRAGALVHHPIMVRWSEGITNSYRPEDLESTEEIVYEI